MVVSVDIRWVAPVRIGVVGGWSFVVSASGLGTGRAVNDEESVQGNDERNGLIPDPGTIPDAGEGRQN
jgi:hypothetical protein